MTTLWRETGRPFLDLSRDDYEEKNYTKEQITSCFVNACNNLLPIFDSFNSKYYAEAKTEVANNKLDLEIQYLSWLVEDSNMVVSILNNPLDIHNYEMLIERFYSYSYRYEHLDIRSLEDVSFVANEVKKDDFFSSFVSVNIFKYAKFLSVFISNLYCYLCLYYENLNKKYYYRFEFLVRDAYNYFYFREQQNPNLLITDYGLLDMCKSYCTPLEHIQQEKN